MKRGIKSVKLSEYVERYVDCPYCGILISDSQPTIGMEDGDLFNFKTQDGVDYQSDTIDPGKMQCPNCKKWFYVEW